MKPRVYEISKTVTWRANHHEVYSAAARKMLSDTNLPGSLGHFRRANYRNLIKRPQKKLSVWVTGDS